MRFRFIICAASLALVAAACGADDATTVVETTGTEAAEEAAPEAGAQTADEGAADNGTAAEVTTDDSTADESAAPVPALAGPGDVPDLQMINMHTGTAVNLQSVVDGQTPLLFWFWAPH